MEENSLDDRSNKNNKQIEPVTAGVSRSTHPVSASSNMEAMALSRDEDNEFILDGFDFSTGVSICQELDLDEDDGRMDEKISSSLLAHEDVKSPSQLSSVLLKALGVNGHDAASSSASNHVPSSSPPAQQPLRNKSTTSTTSEDYV